MNNICDVNNIMSFLTHYEDNELTEAIGWIVNNLAKNDRDELLLLYVIACILFVSTNQHFLCQFHISIQQQNSSQL